LATLRSPTAPAGKDTVTAAWPGDAWPGAFGNERSTSEERVWRTSEPTGVVSPFTWSTAPVTMPTTGSTTGFTTAGGSRSEAGPVGAFEAGGWAGGALAIGAWAAGASAGGALATCGGATAAGATWG
jgi:hypothetical protein